MLVGAVLLFASSSAQAGSTWRIVKDHWSDADERGFSEFVEAIGKTNCNSAENCLQTAANPYRFAAPLPGIHVDCAKWPYLLRAYYAWNNGLPFSYISVVRGEPRADLRYTKTSNSAVSRTDIVDGGNGIDAASTIRVMLANVFTGMFRIDPRESADPVSDFYSPAIRPGSIRPGTMVYDLHGHVVVVYKVDSDGRVYYMDGNPDLTITRGVYGAQFGQSPIQLGGGFKNWRPFRLLDARADQTGHLIGGHTVFVRNGDISDFSLVQYTGNVSAGRKSQGAQFAYNGIPLGPFEYVRVSLSSGKTRDAPVYALRATIRTICGDLRQQPTSWRTQAGREVAQFQIELTDSIRLWVHRDPRLAYDGESLKQDLESAYAEESRACGATAGNSGKEASSFDDLIHELRRARDDHRGNIKALIDNIGEQVAFHGMTPVGR